VPLTSTVAEINISEREQLSSQMEFGKGLLPFQGVDRNWA
jgi:hypothetical protein